MPLYFCGFALCIIVFFMKKGFRNTRHAVALLPWKKACLCRRFASGLRGMGALFCLFFFFFSMPAGASEVAQLVQDFFSTDTMTGNFTQTDARGRITRGIFYMERPGKIRFSYKTTPLTVIADGTSVAVNNRQLDTWDLYRLSQTPLKILLSDHVALGPHSLVGVKRSSNVIALVFQDKSLGSGRITISFDRHTHALLQWVIIDQQNLKTMVRVDHVREGVQFTPAVFKIPYQHIAMQRKNNGF